jgi:hypothetical protein
VCPGTGGREESEHDEESNGSYGSVPGRRCLGIHLGPTPAHGGTLRVVAQIAKYDVKSEYRVEKGAIKDVGATGYNVELGVPVAEISKKTTRALPS